ncbi:MAG: hypothetical protein JXR34_09755 [Bacteroidales bacterium]|nr:hypothetical protein [Bacteroidales bacterium]
MNRIEMESMDLLMADIMRSLTEMKYYNAVILFVRQFNIDITPTTSEMILQQYGWNLYYAYNDLIHHRKAMLGHCRIDERDLKWELVQFSRATTNHRGVYIRMVINIQINVVLKREIKKKNPSYKFVIDFCEAVNPQLLDTTSFDTEFQLKGKKKTVELQSARENYYSIYTKALLHEGLADLCIATINEALKDGFKFHFDMDVWLYYRMAEAEILRGNFEAAIKIIREKVLPQKCEWFVYKTMARCHFYRGENRQALTLSLKALELHGALKYKTDLLYLITQIYLSLREKDKERKVIALGRRIIEKEGWSVNHYYEIMKSDLIGLEGQSNKALYEMIVADMRETIQNHDFSKTNGN